MCFLPSTTAAASSTSSASAAAPSSAPSPGPRKWHSGKLEAYIAAQPPSLVCSATISLGPLSWVRGYVSLPALGPGGAWSWKMCSPMRMQDLGGAAGPPAGLDQSALAAHLARELGAGAAALGWSVSPSCSCLHVLGRPPGWLACRCVNLPDQLHGGTCSPFALACSGAAVPTSAAAQPGAALATNQRHLRCSSPAPSQCCSFCLTRCCACCCCTALHQQHQP